MKHRLVEFAGVRFGCGVMVGGGDLGDSCEHDRDRVADGVCNGLVARARAAGDYGVVPKADGRADVGATAVARR